MIFLSYASKDVAKARLIKAILEIAAGYTVWMDEERLQSGTEWQEQAYKAIRSAEVFFCLISKHSLNSHPVKNEWLQAQRRLNDGQKISIVPILLEDIRRDVWEQNPAFGDANTRTYISFYKINHKTASQSRIIQKLIDAASEGSKPSAGDKISLEDIKELLETMPQKLADTIKERESSMLSSESLVTSPSVGSSIVNVIRHYNSIGGSIRVADIVSRLREDGFIGQEEANDIHKELFDNIEI